MLTSSPPLRARRGARRFRLRRGRGEEGYTLAVWGFVRGGCHARRSCRRSGLRPTARSREARTAKNANANHGTRKHEHENQGGGGETGETRTRLDPDPTPTDQGVRSAFSPSRASGRKSATSTPGVTRGQSSDADSTLLAALLTGALRGDGGRRLVRRVRGMLRRAARFPWEPGFEGGARPGKPVQAGGPPARGTDAGNRRRARLARASGRVVGPRSARRPKAVNGRARGAAEYAGLDVRRRPRRGVARRSALRGRWPRLLAGARRGRARRRRRYVEHRGYRRARRGGSRPGAYRERRSPGDLPTAFTRAEGESTDPGRLR